MKKKEAGHLQEPTYNKTKAGLFDEKHLQEFKES